MRSRFDARAADFGSSPTDDPYQWVLSTGKLELVYIEGIYVAAVAFSGGRWEIIDVAG